MKSVERDSALLLRRNGRSIKDIANKLHVSQGTVSRWCAGIHLTSSQKLLLDEKRRVAGIASLAPWIERNKNMKSEDLKKQKSLGIKDLGKISHRDLLLLGLGLYWGEGYKRGSQEWGFTNSDPEIIRTIIAWVRRCYGVDPSRIHARLTVNKLYEKEIPRITKGWSEETNIPICNFSSPSVITGYGKTERSARTYRGTLRIKIRSGTSLRRRILASINAVDDQISPNSRKVAS